MIAFLALAACTGDQISYSGFRMDDFFPFDGERTWTFTNLDASVPNTVVATLNSEAEVLDQSLFIYTVDYALGCPDDADTASECTAGEPFRFSKIRWSSDQSLGVLIHSFDDAAGATTTFEPPLKIADTQGVVADQWTTATSDGGYTATFAQIGACPVLMDVDWDQCIRIHLDDDGDESTPPTKALHGDWYAVPSFNVIAFQLNGDADMWQLSDTTFTN